MESYFLAIVQFAFEVKATEGTDCTWELLDLLDLSGWDLVAEDKLLFVNIQSLQGSSNLAVKSGFLLVALSEGGSGRHSLDAHCLS